MEVGGEGNRVCCKHGYCGDNDDNIGQVRDQQIIIVNVKVWHIVKDDSNFIPKLLICTVLLSHLGIVLFISACLNTVFIATGLCSVR